MKTNKQTISCEGANQMDLVDYLATLGHKPKKVSANDYWYLSPFRDEKTASFKVNRRKNVWYDHGQGVGGSLIDFGLRYFNCQIPALLEKLTSQFPFHPQILPTIAKPQGQAESSLRILDITSINSMDLFQYIKDRRIDFHIANSYCKQITFEIGNKTSKALGFPNDNGGYELRNPSFKGSVSPKATTTIRNASKEMSVFEGFFDFLSYLTIYQNQSLQMTNFLVLNSTAFFEKSRPIMEEYEKVRLYLDHDFTGEGCAKLGLSWSQKYQDESKLYVGHKDLNEWVQSIGKAQKRSCRPGLK